MTKIRANAVVIGSGPGGAVTAATLAEHGKDVLILEEGRDLPLESCVPFSAEEMAQKYRARGLNVALGNAKINFAEARTVGGGSEINAGLYHRTPADALERWRREFGVNRAWPEDLHPHFEHCEEALSVSTSKDGVPPASLKLADGASMLGWRSMEVPRWFKSGERQSMTKTFLPRATAAGAKLLPETRAVRLHRSGNGWRIETADATEIEADAVFLCCGALQTPLLLRRSGITHNVGDTLAMHPTVKVVAQFDGVVNDENMGVPVHQVKEFSPRMSFGCSISSPPYLALALSGYPCAPQWIRESWRNMAVYYAMITGPQTGKIRAIPGCSDPLIRYKLSAEDLHDLATGLRRLTELLLAAGARTVYPVIAGAKPVSSSDQLSTIPATLIGNDANLMTIHLFSSCPMGEDRSRTAVDSFGRVWDAPNLSIHDASLIPTAPGVNPQGTVMALARRNTLNYLERTA
jgi:choline dehydrogenase-like flavoprotein